MSNMDIIGDAAYDKRMGFLNAASTLTGADEIEVSRIIKGRRVPQRASLSLITNMVKAVGVDVRKFGLKLAEDAPSFDNATKWEDAVDSGEVLLLPVGTLIGSTFPGRTGLIVNGQGWGSILKLADGSDLPVMPFDAADDWHLFNFMLDGNKDNQTDGVSTARGLYVTTSGADWRIHKIKIKDVKDHGFMTAVPECGVNAEIAGCVAEGCGSSAHTIAGGTGGTGFATGGDGMSVVSCLGTGNQLNGFKGIGAVFDTCIARDNIGGGFETGFSTPEVNHTGFVFCRSHDNGGDGFRNQGQGDWLEFIGCMIHGNGGSGITLMNGVDKAIVLGNTIRNNGLTNVRSSTQGADGISIIATGGTVPSNIIIDHNIIQGHANNPTELQYSIFCDKGLSDVVIGQGNITSGAKTQEFYVGSSAEPTLNGFKGHGADYKDVSDTVFTGSLSGDLKSYTIPANCMKAGMSLEFDIHGTVSGVNNTKVMRLQVGATTQVIASMIAAETQNWGCRGTITVEPGGQLIVTGFAYEVGGTTSTFMFAISASPTAAITIKATVTLGSTADTVTQKLMKLRLKN